MDLTPTIALVAAASALTSLSEAGDGVIRDGVLHPPQHALLNLRSTERQLSAVESLGCTEVPFGGTSLLVCPSSFEFGVARLLKEARRAK